MPALLQPLAILLDAEAALREAVRLGAPERPLLDEAAVDDHERDRDEEAAMPTHAGLSPTVTRTMPAPISVPTRPIRMVSHAGIGSGPGTANRASAPVTNAVTITVMTLRHEAG